MTYTDPHPERTNVHQPGDVVVYHEDDATVWDFTHEAREWYIDRTLATIDAAEREATFESVSTDNDGVPIFSA